MLTKAKKTHLSNYKVDRRGNIRNKYTPGRWITSDWTGVAIIVVLLMAMGITSAANHLFATGLIGLGVITFWLLWILIRNDD